MYYVYLFNSEMWEGARTAKNDKKKRININKRKKKFSCSPPFMGAIKKWLAVVRQVLRELQKNNFVGLCFSNSV